MERTAPLSTPALEPDGASPVGPIRRTGRRNTRGSTLLVVLLLLLVFSITSIMVLNAVTTTVRSSHVRTYQVEALNMADAGIDLGMAWLTTQPIPPTDSTLRNMTNFFGTTGTITAPFGVTGTTLTVNIFSDTSNSNNTQKKYIIEAKGVMPSGVYQIVRAYVAQVSFGEYSYFTVDDGGGFWDFNNHFEGPFHTNDGDGNPSEFLWTQTPPSGPIFEYDGPGAFSDSGNPTWWLNSIGNVQAPASASDFNAIAAGGQATVLWGDLTDVNGNTEYYNGQAVPKSPVIALPTTDYTQEYVSVGQIPPSPATSPASNLPTTPGVTLSNSGGMYIHDDNSILLSVNVAGDQVVTVTTPYTGGTKVQTVTLYPVTSGSGASMVTVNTPTVGLPSTTTTTLSTPFNGVIFSDGNINSLSGTVANNQVSTSSSNGVTTYNITFRNELTIEADDSNNKDIYLTNSVKYATPRTLSLAQSADTMFNNYAGTLGLLATNVIVTSGAGPQLEFDALIMAAGLNTSPGSSFYAANPGVPSGNSGVMLSIGGVVVHDAGVFAYGDMYGNVVAGYVEQYHYDQRLANYPPPYFPTTGNHYTVVSWQNVTSTLN